MILTCEAIILSNDRRNVIIFSENCMEYRGLNRNKHTVIRYQIDSDKMPNEKTRCDNAFEITDRIYFIELKGSDIKKAATQITQTIENFKTLLNGMKVFGRIVCSKAPRPAIRSSQFVSLQRTISKFGGDLKTATQKLEEQL
ncbi:MAG: hypothetical protein PHG14_03495 [Desulfobacter postgatei]|uniref:hypothetical protein n=1 Tax=Desulfobacter postgatei TaxID=2293 RepID=UPI0023F048CC|nr:hypothetical protein [Desulfobacter postgatei]MDD4272774.1 hypothetical protein [Desulfobacter postgatei]